MASIVNAGHSAISSMYAGSDPQLDWNMTVLGHDIAQSPAATPTRLIYRSPSGRTEVAVRGAQVVINVLRGADSLGANEADRLAAALLRVDASPPPHGR